MARIKIGNNIKNYGDVTTLIIDLINRSNNFDSNFIVRLTYNYVQDSQLNISEKDINRMVHNVLDSMQRNGYVSYSQDVYTLKSSNFSIEEYYKLCQAGLII